MMAAPSTAVMTTSDVHAGKCSQGFNEQLEADEDEHRREPVLEVLESLLRLGEEEVERAQPEDRERVAREDDERVRRHGEDRRDGVHREDEVTELDGEQDEEERRDGEHQLPPTTWRVKKRWPS